MTEHPFSQVPETGTPKQIDYPAPDVLHLRGRNLMSMGISWWAATELTPEHYSIGWSDMSKEQVSKFAHQLLVMIGEERQP